MSIVERRVTQRWIGASSHQFGSSASSTRGYTTPPYMFLDPGNGPRSKTTTSRPARASVSAAHAPAGPAPTTITSTSGIRVLQLVRAQPCGQLVEDGVGVAHDGEISELHHRAVAVDVDTHDVIGLAEAARVLDGATYREGDVQRRVDDDASGSDLALVA